MSLAGTVARMVARYGAAHTLLRTTNAAGPNDWTEGAPTNAFYPCRAREFDGRGQDGELKPGLSEGETTLTIDAATIAVAPRKGDRVALGTFTATDGVSWSIVVDVAEPRIRGAVSAYKLRIRK